MFISAVRKRRVSITAAALLAAGLVVPALPTAAAEPAPGRNVSYLEFMWKETLMGAFFTSDADHSDVLYYSDDGKRFDELAVAYQDKYPHDPTRDISTQGSIHHTLGDPSIMYHDGAFWMLSAWQRRDGKFWPTIGVSQDGKKWAYPEGQFFDKKKYPGISLQPPAKYGKDVVAPEWFRDNRGNIYIIFSAGYFGLFNNRPYKDKMVPYMVKVNKLSFNGFSTYDPRLPKITFKPGKAKRINLDSEPAIDRIDGAAFHDDDGSYYLVIKRDGAYNEIWHNWSMSPNGWKRIQNNLAVGTEGPSLTKLYGRYYLYSDMLHTWSKDGSRGVVVHSAPTPIGPWENHGRIATMSKRNRFRPNRHGTVIRVKDWDAKKKLYTLYTGKQPPRDPLKEAWKRLRPKPVLLRP
ncbi:MAG TPA: family 43 glycosylhydrolase [Corynebacteriales bacterium]|nr:family 43 glycosylhydrolase [Mycobacteriales bacterium]